MWYVVCRRPVTVVLVVCLLTAGLGVSSAAAAGTDRIGPDRTDPVVDGPGTGSGVPATGPTASNGSATRWDGTDGPTTAAAGGDGEIRVTYRVSRTPADPETVRVNYTAVVPANVNELRANLRGLAPHTVVSTDRIQYDPGTEIATATSEFGTETTVGLTYTVESNVSSGFGLDTVETSDWAFVTGEQLLAAHDWVELRDSPATFTDSHVVDGEGYAVDGFAFLGPVTTEQRTAGDQSFRLVVPEAADPAVEPGTVLDGLADASGMLQVGDSDPEVTAFVAPAPIRSGGRATGAVFWASEDTTLAADSTWFHEYVHTRQAWTDQDFELRARNDVEWLTEASADYYGGYVAWQTGRTDAASFREYVATDRYAGAVLQDADRDAKELKNYFKGRRVLAALDIRLHQHTGGDQTLLDVVRQINALPGENLTYADFRGEVVAATNESTGAWLDRHVGSSDVPAIPTDIRAAYDTGLDSGSTLAVSLSPSSVTAGERTDVTVTVTDGSGTPVGGATIESTGLGVSTTTDAAGEATLSVDAGSPAEYTVSVAADGYTGSSATLSVENGTGDGSRLPTTPGEPTFGDVLAVIDAFNTNSEYSDTGVVPGFSEVLSVIQAFNAG
jgi:hypothetical protein